MTTLRLGRTVGPVPVTATDAAGAGHLKAAAEGAETGGYATGRRASQLRIINFHGVGEPRRELEPGEAPYWLEVGRFREVIDAIAAHPDRDRIRITFDDGNISDLAIAAPILLERGLTAGFFVLTDRIGGRGSLDIADIRELLHLGMRIGSHGTAHRDWTTLAPIQLATELTSSKRLLEDACGREITAAAIPFGRYRKRVLQALRRADYRTAYSSDGGSANVAYFLQPRSSVRCETTPLDIRRALSGQEALGRRLRRSISVARKRFV